MMSGAKTPAEEIPPGLLEALMDGPLLRSDRMEAARSRLADGARPTSFEVADAIVAGLA